MIVNPQVFNYRLTIGTLLAAITFLVVYGFTAHNELTANNDFLKQEKKLLQNELNTIIDKYDILGSETISLKSQIENERSETEIARDSLELLKVDVAVIPRYREEIMFLNQLNKQLKSESHTEVISALEEEKAERQELLKLQSHVIVSLEEEKRQLKETIEKGQRLHANSFKAEVYRKKASGQNVPTKKASQAEFVEVCFVIAENPIAPRGYRELYIQVLGPDNNVVADKGAVSFGKTSLIYSSKLNIDYKNEAEDVCSVISNEESFIKGTYYISIFEGGRKLGQTQIDLY